MRCYYFKSKWNLFDFFILIAAIVDVVLEATVLLNDDSNCQGQQRQVNAKLVDPTVLKIFRGIKLFRLVRSLRLFKVSPSQS